MLAILVRLATVEPNDIVVRTRRALSMVYISYLLGWNSGALASLSMSQFMIRLGV